MGFMTIFYCLRFETSLFVASYDSQGYGGGIRPRLHTEAPNVLVITSRYGPDRKHRSSIVACVFIAPRTCLPSRCLELVAVYSPYLLSLHSNGFLLWDWCQWSLIIFIHSLGCYIVGGMVIVAYSELYHLPWRWCGHPASFLLLLGSSAGQCIPWKSFNSILKRAMTTADEIMQWNCSWLLFPRLPVRVSTGTTVIVT
jgi:hypothetical protein